MRTPQLMGALSEYMHPTGRPVIRPPESFGISGYADALAGFVEELGLGSPHVAGLSFGGILALALYGRHPNLPATLVLASAYSGRAGSLPADAVTPASGTGVLADLSADEFVGTLLPTMFSKGTSPEAVDEFGASMRAFHPTGFRAMARASAENVRDVLVRIEVPTLLVYGGRDVRAPLPVAEDLHRAVAGSTLVVLPDAGHVCNIEAPEAFNRAVRRFLHDHPGVLGRLAAAPRPPRPARG